MDERTQNLMEECRRQEESCLYTSTALFEWLKPLRRRKVFLVVAPIILGGLATWPLLAKQDEYRWVTGACALLAGFAPAIYKALDFDINLGTVAKHAHQFKVLQDRFRQCWRIAGLGAFGEFKKEFDDLMIRMDEARGASLTPPERYFKKAKEKIEAGHYSFSVDETRTEGEKLPDGCKLPEPKQVGTSGKG
jgi:hypothetical protein